MSITKKIQTRKSFYMMAVTVLGCPFVGCFVVSFYPKAHYFEGKKIVFCEQKISSVEKAFQLHSYRQGLKAVLYL